MGGVITSQKRTNPRSYQDIVDQYGKRCQWLRNEKFLKDLEGDSVDTEILDEELRVLEEQEPQTCRGKTAKVMETSPVQIAVCVLILVDALIVITEILLDLHAMRSQQREATASLYQTLDFLRYQYADDLSGYQGDDVKYILEKLRQKYRNASSAGTRTRTKRCFESEAEQTIATSSFVSHSHEISSASTGLPVTFRQKSINADDLLRITATEIDTGQSNKFVDYIRRRRRRRCHHIKFPESDEKTTPLETGISLPSTRSGGNARILLMGDATSASRGSVSERNKRILKRKLDYIQHDAGTSVKVRSNGDSLKSGLRKIRRSADILAFHEATDGNVVEESRSPPAAEEPTRDHEEMSLPEARESHGMVSFSGSAHAEKLLKIAHILHFASIAILGLFVLQVFLKLFGMGSEFFKSKLEIFDGIIILASFALDLIFVEGISGAQGEEAIALLIIFLIWRILRIINGIMVTSKKRQEFRIKLQRRACRRAEKKIEILEEDISWKDKEIHSLKSLCLRSGATEDDIESIQSKRRPFFSKMDTSSGLSSIASLSLGFTMSMRHPNHPTPPPVGVSTSVSSAPFSSSASEAVPSALSTPPQSLAMKLQRQYTIHEPANQLSRMGVWRLAGKLRRGETRPGASGQKQSLPLKRMQKEHGPLIPFANNSPITSANLITTSANSNTTSTDSYTTPANSITTSANSNTTSANSNTTSTNLNTTSTNSMTTSTNSMTTSANSITNSANSVITSVNAWTTKSAEVGPSVREKQESGCLKVNLNENQAPPFTSKVLPVSSPDPVGLKGFPLPPERVEDSLVPVKEVPTSAKIPTSATTPEATLCTRDSKTEELQLAGTSTSRLEVSPSRSSDADCCGQTMPKSSRRSLEGAVRWFRWRSAGNHSSVKGTSSTVKGVNSSVKNIHANQTTSSPASLKRSAWKSAFQRHKTEASPATDL